MSKRWAFIADRQYFPLDRARRAHRSQTQEPEACPRWPLLRHRLHPTWPYHIKNRPNLLARKAQHMWLRVRQFGRINALSVEVLRPDRPLGREALDSYKIFYTSI
jgi:hypothetical protein